MKLVDVECSFEGNKITFYFTSDGRVDFRELVKDLAGVFRSRIELRQIGVRDEAKMLGGIGICGRPLCCSQFLTDFHPVSTKMAKTQSLSLNPTKISGTCGRLMCCLRYEEEAYESLVKAVPKNGAFVETPAGFGTVTQVNILRGTVKVKLDGDGESVIKSYNGDEVAAVPGGRPKNGEAPVHVLKRREPEEEAPMPEEDEVIAAEELAEVPVEPMQPTVERVRRKNRSSRSSNRRSEDRPRREKREGENQTRREGETAPRRERSEDRPRREKRESGEHRAKPREKRENRQDSPRTAQDKADNSAPSGSRPRRHRGGRRRDGGPQHNQAESE